MMQFIMANIEAIGEVWMGIAFLALVGAFAYDWNRLGKYCDDLFEENLKLKSAITDLENSNKAE